MQCKNIPTRSILEFMAKNPGEFDWHNWFFGDERDVRNAMPDGFNIDDKLVHAKMRMLIKKGLIDGCDCGCRGDFIITQKGLNRIK